jgi:hypothetical protein
MNICQNCKHDFSIEPGDFMFYEKMGVPVPTFCPECRQKRRLVFRNFLTLYKRISDKSGKMIISMYHTDTAFPVWSRDEWYEDDWDAMSYGTAYDLSQSFFEQYKTLSDKVPRFALMMNNSPGCVYANMCNRSSNCYFVFGCVDNEYCDYGHIVWNSKECVDCLYVYKSEYCYECTDVLESSRLLYSQECTNCVDSVGLFDCRGCTNCIGCVGLRNQSYHIFNQQVSKEAYAKFQEQYPLHDQANITYILSQMKNIVARTPLPYIYGSKNVNVSGNHIYNSKNIQNSFDIKGGENSAYGGTVRTMIDSYDINFTPDIENSYECIFASKFGLKFCHIVIDSTEAVYSEFCFNCNHVFGCIGLRKKEYCILNKQYTKEEYEILVPQIIAAMKARGEWGEFFPITLSPFAYNESTANEYFPLSQNEAIQAGYRWQHDIPVTKGQENAAVGDIAPEMRYDTTFLKDKVFSCNLCKRNYRFTEHEIGFYERFRLGLPTECFFCRHERRMQVRLSRTLYDRMCMCTKANHLHGNASCTTVFKTSYAPDRPEIVYCEKCYQQEMY